MVIILPILALALGVSFWLLWRRLSANQKKTHEGPFIFGGTSAEKSSRTFTVHGEPVKSGIEQTRGNATASSTHSYERERGRELGPNEGEYQAQVLVDLDSGVGSADANLSSNTNLVRNILDAESQASQELPASNATPEFRAEPAEVSAEQHEPAVAGTEEADGGGPCAVPSHSGPPPEGNGVGTGSGAALDAVEASPITEEHAAPVPSEGGKAVAANEQGELAGQDSSGTAVINDGGATGLSPAGPKKAPVLESEWEAYSERSGSGTGKPQPTAKSKTAKGAETPLQTKTKTTETEPELPESEKEPPEPTDISEYNGLGVASLPDSYLWWNGILLGRFMSVAESADILLATTPRALAAALFDGEDERVSPEEAEKRFANAVAAAYKVGVMGSPARLKVFRRLVCSDGIPICAAFLALSVLAAHKMHMDETTWSSDYYSRLVELLGTEEGANGQPVGFRTDEFESLWLFLADWISKKTGCSLVLPPGNAQKRFIAYPLAHVPLRQLDLEKLPAFFDWAGYSSENLPSIERLEDDLRRWDQSYGSFSNAGQKALNDSRVGAVLTQVRSELRAWDGVVSDSTGIRYSQVEILLETIGNKQMFLERLMRGRCSQWNQVSASAKTEGFFERKSELLMTLGVLHRTTGIAPGS